MKLDCPKCAAEIPAENMNQDRLVAKCAICNSVFNFGKEISGRGRVRRQRLNARQLRGMGLKMKKEEGTLTIRLSWFNDKTLFLTFFAVMWNGMMFFLVSSVVSSEATRTSPFAFFMLPHFCIGLALIYFVVAGYVNETQVSVNDDWLSIRHGPLPFWGNKEVATGSIAQLYIKHKPHWRYYRYPGSYELYAITGKNRQQKLLSGLDDPDLTAYVEQEVERFLGLQDNPVRGEHGRV
jgi:hypothetical protein